MSLAISTCDGILRLLDEYGSLESGAAAAEGGLVVDTARTLSKPTITARPDHPRPPAPEPRETVPGPLRFLRAMRNAPIETFTRADFEQPLVGTQTIVGPVVVVSAAPALRHVLIDNAENYRRERIQRSMLARGLGIGLLAAEGEQWRRQRRIAGSFFAPRRIAGLAADMAAAADSLVNSWERLPNATPIDVGAELQIATIHVLEQTLFTDGLGRERDRFAKALTHCFDCIGRLDPLDAFDAPRWLPRLSRLRARPSVALFQRMARSMVDARQQRLSDPSGPAPDDLLTILLLASDAKTGRRLSMQEVEENIVTFIAAGFETVAAMLTWALYLLTLDHEWRERVEAEADRELPDGRYVDGSLARLIATRAVIEETMRLYPPVPITTRQAIGPDRLMGEPIAPGTIVIVSPWVIHRHRLLWKDPDLFDPARFLPDAREAIDRFAYLPFGAGPRTCIGASFAMQEMIILLAMIVRRFRLELAAGHRVWPVHRITLRPRGGMPMVLYRRQPAA